MGNFPKWTLAAASVLLLSACAKKNQEADQPFGPSGIPPQLRAKTEGGGNPVSPGGNVAPMPNITPQDDIVFTDPDNPDAGIPELENLMAAPKKGPWEESETVARQTAAREGKPILIWFTDSSRSPMCKALAAELFSTLEFGEWAAKKLVRLRVDASVSVDDPELSLDEKITRQTDLKRYVVRMKKRYKILGHPSVLMLNPGGEVIGRYRGYKRGDADYFWGLIKQGEVASSTAYISWRKNLEGKGYREWQDQKGRKVFAKLVSYSKGTLVLIEPGGERYKTHESKLCKNDRQWIDGQKTLRGIL